MAYARGMNTESQEQSRVPAWLLPVLMLSGAFAGMLIGGLLGARWGDPELGPLVLALRLAGQIFLSLLKALIVPLVVTSIVVAVANMGDLRKVGRIAGATGFYFLTTTFMAVGLGMVLVNIIRPGLRGSAAEGGAALSEAQRQAADQTALDAIAEVLSGMFPANLIEAASEGNILGLIVFSLLFGAALSVENERGRVLVDALDTANRALLRLVQLVVWLAPIGILGLVADRAGRAGGGAAVLEELGRLGWYAATVLLGLGIHAFVVLPLILFLLTRRNPFKYLTGMVDSFLTAFGTASSAATMAVTMRCVVEKNRVSRKAADFVIPLGTTVNMDGTALYEAVAVIFIAQTLGVDLTGAQQLIILVTATLAAIGAAAIPEAGLVTMVMVLSAVGLPAEAVGLLLSIDWLLDRFRTSVNVWGDAVGAAIIDKRVLGNGGDEMLAVEGHTPTPTGTGGS